MWLAKLNVGMLCIYSFSSLSFSKHCPQAPFQKDRWMLSPWNVRHSAWQVMLKYSPSVHDTFFSNSKFPSNYEKYIANKNLGYMPASQFVGKTVCSPSTSSRKVHQRALFHSFTRSGAFTIGGSRSRRGASAADGVSGRWSARPCSQWNVNANVGTQSVIISAWLSVSDLLIQIIKELQVRCATSRRTVCHLVWHHARAG